MDPMATVVIGFISSVAVVIVAQFIIAARSSKEKLESANNNAIVSEIKALDSKMTSKLDKLSDGQAMLNKEIETVKKRLGILKRKLDKAEKELEEAKRQLKERQSESVKKSESIENLKESIKKNEDNVKELRDLYKKMEQWQGLKNVQDIITHKD